jgi:hypothetical protein
MRAFRGIAIFLLIPIISIVTAAVTFGQASQVRYFRHLAMNHNSPYESFEPLNEITAEQAKGVEHYEVSYDARGRISEMGALWSTTT